MNYKLEVNVEEDVIEFLFYNPAMKKDLGYGMMVTKEDITLDMIEDFVLDCRQFEADEEAKKN